MPEVDDALRDLRCPTCGYDLTGLREHRCPECGNCFDPVRLRLPPPSRAVKFTAIGLLTYAAVTLLIQILLQIGFATIPLLA